MMNDAMENVTIGLAAPGLDRRAIVQFAGAAAVLLLITILFLDRPIATWSHDVVQRPVWCIWLTHIADFPQPAATVGLIGAGMAWVCGWRPGSAGRVLLSVCVATLSAEALKDVLKFAAGRPWPETWVNHNPSWIGSQTFGFFPFHGGPGYLSFPSGHTTAITAPSAVLWRHAPRFRGLWLLLPSLVATGLIACDYHFLSDCMAGALTGLSCGIAIDRMIVVGAPTRGPL